MGMKRVSLEKIAEITGGEYRGPKNKRHDRITGVCTDNRNVEQGYLFVCIQGDRFDGHSFAKDAYERGATCRLAEKELDDEFPYILVPSTLKALRELAGWYRRLFSIPVIGVIGSVGKTTAKELIASVLSREKYVLRTTGNLNNEIGVPLTLLSLQEEHEAAVIEMGISDFGEMSRLADMVRPDICVFTSIGYSHLEKLGDLNGVLKAKSEIFDYMNSESMTIVNGDDDLLRNYDPGTMKLSFGIDEGNDIRAENIETLGFKGVSCDICFGSKRIFTFIPAFGTHIVYGALAAASVGMVLELNDESIIRGLADYRAVGGRSNVTDTGYITLIDDCYNANPTSMAAAIRSLSSLRSLGSTQGKRVAILGDMKELGDDSKRLHREVGHLAADMGIDLLICCGTEAKEIYNGFQELCDDGLYFETKKEILPRLNSLIDRGDVVLVKASHAMEFEEIVNKLKEVQG